MDIFGKIKQYIMVFGLEKFGRYYGVYEGVVIKNNDEKNELRLLVRVPQIHGTNTPDTWAIPSGLMAGNGMGFYSIPNEGEKVNVQFKNGDPDYPVWSFGKFKNVPDFKNKQIWQSYAGNRITLYNKEKKIEIQSKDGIKVSFDDNFTIGTGNYSIPLGELLTAQLEINTARIDALYNAINNGVVVAQDGGASFQASMKAILASVTTKENYSQVLSKNAKTQ